MTVSRIPDISNPLFQTGVSTYNAVLTAEDTKVRAPEYMLLIAESGILTVVLGNYNRYSTRKLEKQLTFSTSTNLLYRDKTCLRFAIILFQLNSDTEGRQWGQLPLPEIMILNNSKDQRYE